MPLPFQRPTLTQFLIEERRRYPHASGDFNSLLLNVALACKSIARTVACGALGSAPDAPAATLAARSNDTLLHVTEWGGQLAAMSSAAMAAPYQIAAPHPRGKYLLVFDPLDGASHIDINAPLGSVFSVLRAPDGEAPPDAAAFLQAGHQQVAAGYALYGPSTMLVLTVGNGVVGFTLDPNLGEFMLTHPALQVPADTDEFAINACNSRFWGAPVKRYVDECLAGRAGPRGKDFSMRWIASTVAEAHRILLRGGVFLQPRDYQDPPCANRLRLLHQANPIAFLMEQAGAAASTGHAAVSALAPDALQQRTGLIFGSRHEVARLERYHNSPAADLANPLFHERGLFRVPG